jgi:hypothetical protein
MYWSTPPNDQKDIVEYRIYRRSYVTDAWTRIAKLSGEYANYLLDDTVEYDTPYIYAIASVDIHGIESFLSSQVQAEIDSKIQFRNKEKPFKWISGSGGERYQPKHIFKQFPEERGEIMIAKKNLLLKTSTQLRDTTKTFIIKVKSLDTHEKHEIKVVTKNSNIIV